jgi:hypothetical protein
LDKYSNEAEIISPLKQTGIAKVEKKKKEIYINERRVGCAGNAL